MTQGQERCILIHQRVWVSEPTQHHDAWRRTSEYASMTLSADRKTCVDENQAFTPINDFRITKKKINSRAYATFQAKDKNF